MNYQNVMVRHVVRFVSRKAKEMIIRAKKVVSNRDYAFRGNAIYINEHLTSLNKQLFRDAKAKKRTLGYKYLWTRNGKIFIRKTDTSQAIAITSDEDVLALV